MRLLGSQSHVKRGSESLGSNPSSGRFFCRPQPGKVAPQTVALLVGSPGAVVVSEQKS